MVKMQDIPFNATNYKQGIYLIFINLFANCISLLKKFQVFLYATIKTTSPVLGFLPIIASFSAPHVGQGSLVLLHSAVWVHGAFLR